jgi:hypothetical protein
MHNFHRREGKNLGSFCNFQKTAHGKQSPNGQKFAQSGADVMITIFCDFPQFSAKKLTFFLNTNVMIIFSKFSFVLSQKRRFFR